MIPATLNFLTHRQGKAGSRAGRLLLAAALLLTGGRTARALTATPSTTEGPYYTLSTANNVTTPGNSLYDSHFYTAEGADNDLTHIYSTSSQCTGSIYLLSGHLYNTGGTAIAGAVVELWEADNGGIYWYNSSGSNTNNYSGRDQLFQGYGRAITDSTGNWNFRTVKPGLYTGRIRHFHLRINVNGALLLTTQFMFSEDSASFSSDNVAAPLVQAGTMSLVTLTTTSGTDSNGNSVLIGSKDLVVSYSGTTSGAPTVTSNPASVTPATGSSAAFTVAATGTGTLSYQWYKGRSPASGGTAISGATSATYTIGSVTSSSVGNYYAVVTNTVGSATASVASNAAALTIGTTTSTAPTITTQPASQTVAAGSNATFSVVATGSGTLSYQWYKGTSAISGATASSYTITAVTSASAGSYSVRVANSGGTATSNTATLTVTTVSAPTITTQPASQTVTAGNSATFSVAASGSGTLSYQWYKGATGSGSAISGATGTSYAFSSVASGNAGSYYVVVSNSGGSTTSNAATLTVTEAYSSFAASYGLDAATNGAPSADPDGDGINNALEFLLGGSPMSADTSILPQSSYQLVGGSPALVFTFNCAIPLGGTTWAVEYSTDMNATTWNTASNGVNGVSMTMSSTGTTTTAGRTVYPVTVIIPSNEAQVFVRLRVNPAQ